MHWGGAAVNKFPCIQNIKAVFELRHIFVSMLHTVYGVIVMEAATFSSALLHYRTVWYHVWLTT